MVCNMKKLLEKIYRDKSGQSTVEFAIVTSAILLIIVALGMFWNLGKDGIFVDHAQSSASHHLQDSAMGVIGDVFCC